MSALLACALLASGFVACFSTSASALSSFPACSQPWAFASSACSQSLACAFLASDSAASRPAILVSALASRPAILVSALASVADLPSAATCAAASSVLPDALPSIEPALQPPSVVLACIPRHARAGQKQARSDACSFALWKAHVSCDSNNSWVTCEYRPDLLFHLDLVLESTKLHLLHLASSQPSLSTRLISHFPPRTTI